MDRVARQRHRFDRLRKRLAGDVRRDSADDLDQPGGTCVDDAGLPEHVELLLRSRHGVVAAFDERAQEGLQVVVPARLGLVGELADHGQDRPLGRLADRRPGRVGGAPERGRDGAVFVEALDGTTDDLREDDAGVAARSEQRGVGDVRLPRLERFADGAHREQHVRPRVAVGHRIDVEVVDARPVAVEDALSRAGKLEHAEALAHRPVYIGPREPFRLCPP